MADKDLQSQLASLFTDTIVEPEAAEGMDGSPLGEIVTDLLEGEAPTEPVAAEPIIAQAYPPLPAEPDEVTEEQEIPPASVPASTQKVRPTERTLRIPRSVLPITAIILGALLVSVLVSLNRSTATVWPGFYALYLAACVILVAIVVLQWRLNSSLVSALRDIREVHVAAVRSRTHLEERVAELTMANTRLNKWTLQFQTAAQISHTLTGVLNLENLVQEAVKLIRDRSDLYHVGLFLVDETGQWAELRASTGEIEHPMLTPGYQLEVGGTSSVGWCTANGKVRMGLDVDEDQLLPETRSKMTLPLRSSGRVIGALGLRSARRNAFSQEDATVLQILADQLAAAIDNARAFAELQARLGKAERLQRSTTPDQRPEVTLVPVTHRYERRQPGATPLDGDVLPEIEKAIARREVIAQSTASNGKDQTALVAPVTLRGEAIGVLGFQGENGRQWTADEILLLEDVADQVALAVENARLFEQTQTALFEIQRQADELGMLFNVSQSLSSAPLKTEEIATVISHQFVDLMDVPECAISLLNPRDGMMEIVVDFFKEGEDEIHQREEGERFRLADYPATAYVMETLQPLAIQASDPNADPAELAYMQEHHVATLVIIPLALKGRSIGVIELESWDEERHYTPEELNLAMILTNQAAVALDNARLYEQQQETAQRLREVDRLKTQFLANMSHELRTPLNSIIGFSRVILKGIDGPLTEMQETDLSAIYHSGQHLLGLINDILDLSKIEAGKMELNFDEVNLKPIIKGVMSTAAGLVKDKSIGIEQQVPEDLPVIWADGTRLRQVLLNLVSNAAKFTERGKISLMADCDDEWVTLNVTDTGIGIPQEKLESIFEEFTQVDGSSTRAVGGTGLGLPISRHFVEMHGGEITVESTPGMGSTFKVILPIHAQAESRTPSVDDRPEGHSLNRDRSLVIAVDDDVGVINLYQRYLEGDGYQVMGVTNSSEVLDKAIELQPFAITLDVLMPDKDGWQVLRELKECPQTQHIPIIICSIISDEGRGFSLGAADYLVKPIMEEDLLTALSRLDEQEEEIEILVIDDQVDDILLIRRILEAQPRYRVVEADGGQNGVDLVRQRKPDMIILDLMMPEVDGFAVLEALKGEPDTRDIPVIVVTAQELTDEERQRLMGQVEVLLHKGLFTEHELLEDLGRALSRVESRQEA